MSDSFNFDKVLKDLQSGKDLTGKDSILMPNAANKATKNRVREQYFLI